MVSARVPSCAPARLRATPAPSPRTGHLGVRANAPSRGRTPPQAHAPSPGRRRARRRLGFPAPCTERTAGPSHAPPVRAPPEAAAIPRRYLRRHPDITSEPLLFKAARFSPSRPPPPLPSLHRARHGRRLASRRPARSLGHYAREHFPRDPQHHPGSRIARRCSPLVGTAAHRGRHRRPPPCALTGDPSAPTSATTVVSLACSGSRL
jgi:hypothetical protein